MEERERVRTTERETLASGMLPSRTTTKRATRAAVALVAIGLLSRTAVLWYWTAKHDDDDHGFDDGLEEKKKVLTTTQHQNTLRKRKGQRKRRRRRRRRRENSSSTGSTDDDSEEEEEKSANDESSDSDALSSAYSSAREDEEVLLTREDGDGVGIVNTGGMKAPKRLASRSTTKGFPGGNSDEENFETPVGTPRFVKRETVMDRIKEEWRKEGKESSSDFESSDASQTHAWSEGESRSGPGEYLAQTTDPNFFASTKFFACLELEESRELFGMSEEIEIDANQVLFRQGDESRDGIYVVVEGQLGVYVQSTNKRGGMERGTPSLVKSSSKSSTHHHHHHHHSVKDIRRSLDRAGSPGLPSMGRSQQANRMSSMSNSRTSLDYERSQSARSSLDYERSQDNVRSSSSLPSIAFSIGPAHLTNVLNKGESVGDVDVLDSARRSVSCVAMKNGAKLVRIRQDVLFAFIRKYPRTIQVYLEQAIARLWRVARFTLRDFLELPRDEGCAEHLSPGAEDCLVLKPKPTMRAQTSHEKFFEQNPDASSNSLNDSTKANSAKETPEDANPTNKLLVHYQDELEKYAGGRKTLLANEVFITQRDSQTNAYFILLSGTMRRDAVPWPEGDGVVGPELKAPRLVGAAHAITGARFDETVRCSTDCEILLITPTVLHALCVHAPDAFIALQLAASCSLNRVIRAFIAAGLNRQWLSAGDQAFRSGADATSMYLVISGRVSIYNVALGAMRYRSRGETIGDASMLSQTAHTSTAICTRDCELVRMSRASVQIISAKHPEVAGRLLEHVARKLETNQRDLKTGERYRPEIVTIAIVPATDAVQTTKLPKFAVKLRNALERLGKGSAFILDEKAAEEVVPEGFRRVETAFYRSKLTSWMTRIEEEHRFVLFVGDRSERNASNRTSSGWSRVCVSQADLVLVVAEGGAAASFVPSSILESRSSSSKSTTAVKLSKAGGRSGNSENTNNTGKVLIGNGVDPSPAEDKLLWKRRKKRIVPVPSASEEEFLNYHKMTSKKTNHRYSSDAKQQNGDENFIEIDNKNTAILAQIELVLLHAKGETPKNTRRFYANRPGLRRHHHCRLSSYSDADVDRIARHIAGCGVGVILAGGGGHGLAHLGALKALEDEGVPVDVIGGASQGTLTAALYARTANSSVVSARVKKLASLIASPRRLLTDLTPPFLSILTGETIDKSIRDMFGDKMEIEDLWIPFFCCATNLTTGKLISCTSGSVWRYARASTSVLGFLPPIADEITGDLLVDGAYLNPVPVDVLRKLSRVESTIVVDVEDEHYAAFRSLTARDGGLGGWRLLWERVSPFAHADKLWQSIKSGKGGSKSSSESFKEYSTSSSSESESNSSSSDDKERNEEGSTARRKGKSTEMQNKKKSVATTNAAPSYATLLGALLRATSRREVAEASKSCEIDVYLRPPGVPPFTFHTGFTDKRTDDLIRRARFKAAGVIRKWQQIKFNAIKDNMENTPLQATSYYGFYSSTMQNSQGTLSAMQPNMPPSPRGGGQGGGGGAGMHTITPFHAQQTPPSYPSSSPISADSPRGGRHRRASFEDIDGERDSGVAIVSEQAFIVKKEEELEPEQTKIVRKITPARRIVDSKTIVVDAKAALKKSSSSKLDCV